MVLPGSYAKWVQKPNEKMGDMGCVGNCLAMTASPLFSSVKNLPRIEADFVQSLPLGRIGDYELNGKEYREVSDYD